MSDGLTLVVLAAGMGSRYGGMKQLEPVGPGGATLMDYSVYDAQRAGFTDVVFIIRPETEDAFRPFAAGRYGGRLAVRTAHQRHQDVPDGASYPARSKPWGTGQAVLAAAAAVHGPFAVVNADDCYGKEAFFAAAEFLRKDAGGTPPSWAVVGYRLRETVSASGGVNRAVCRTMNGWLESMEEVLDIVADGGGYTGRGARGAIHMQGDDLVSMNMWCFTPAVFAELRAGFERFLAAHKTNEEYLLPTVIQEIITAGTARVRVLDPGSRWFGLTYPADRPAVERALAELVRAGRYPERLW